MLTVLLRYNIAGMRWMILDLKTGAFIQDLPDCNNFRMWVKTARLRKDMDNMVVIPGPIVKKYLQIKER